MLQQQINSDKFEEFSSTKQLVMYAVVSSDTVSVSSLGKRSTIEEPIRKKNPAVVKISPWTLCDLTGFNVAMATEAQFVLSMPDRIYKSMLIPLIQQDKRLGSKRDLDSQLKTICSNFLILIMSQHEEKVMKERKRNNSHSDDVGYIESEIVDPSMKEGNMLPESERLAEISQVVDYQNYKVGGTFENSNLTAKIMETRSPFTERKDNEFVDLRPSTMSSKGIMSEEQSVECY
ncbi:hypothetical protein FXO38_11110 [Capsicum annuum]|uniref:Uncharacterized protein n=1 Tax=Capsicum annuum TaxID=4072 RepID=A0A2G2Y767_CAPAN|nr:hypothetical protein FXO38_11110 [Capsicum annuum]PHT65603.1 hypothetical protein T459_30028 [Capsicum annuum]